MSSKAARNTRVITFAILAVSFVMYGQSITGPLIANIIADAPQYDPTFISMIQTYPCLGVIISSIAYGALSRRFSNRILLIAATVLYVIGGVAPAFLGSDIPAILAFRVVLGLGTGIYCTIPVALIAENFEGNTGAAVNGWVQVSASIGSVVFQTAAGYIALLDWHMANYLSLLSIVACIVALLLLPKTPKDPANTARLQKAAAEERAARKSMAFSEKYPPIVIAYFVEIFLFVGGIAILMMNASIVIDMKGFGTPVEAGYALSIHTICGIIAGFIFGLVFKACKEYVLAIAAACALVSYLLCGFATNLGMVYAGAGILGFAAPWTCASLYQLIGKYSAPIASAMAVSIATALQFGAQFLLGYWLAPLCTALGLAPAGTDPFLVYAVVYGVLLVAFLVQAATGMKRRQAALLAQDSADAALSADEATTSAITVD